MAKPSPMTPSVTTESSTEEGWTSVPEVRKKKKQKKRKGNNNDKKG